jgi:endoglucanase
MLASGSGHIAAEVAAVATTQEEIAFQGGGGARTSAFRLEPDVAIVVDVTFASDAPQIEKKQTGEHKLGGGPVLTRGSAGHPVVFDRLVETAERAGIPFTIQAAARYTATDADAIYLSRTGVATGVVSVPNRYMHSPNEIVSLDDLEASARLIAEFIRGLDRETEFVPR